MCQRTRRSAASIAPRPAPRAPCSASDLSSCRSHLPQRGDLLLHDLRSARMEAGDVIAEPGLMDPTGRLLSYDRVIANPPFSLKNWGHDFAPNDPHHRFDRYGAVPPKTRGDFAFLLHMLGVTNAQGMVGVVMPHGILFLKRVSDRFDEEIQHAVASGVPRETALSDRDEHEFFVPESARWEAISAASMNLGETLNIASHAIENANTPRLDGVLVGTNWNDETKLGSPANRERIIRSLLNHFGDLDLRDTNLSGDDGGAGNVLGDAYEYLIYQFADDAGKKGGEFYTPREVVRLIVELLEPREGMRICDPAAGSAGMLIYTAQYVRERGGQRPQPGAARAGAQSGNPGHRQAEPAASRPALRPDGGRRRYRRAWPDGPNGAIALLRPGHRQSALQPEELGARLRAQRPAPPL